MQVYKNIAELPEFTNAVITIGTFDGVHLGHAKILQQLVKEAKAIGGTPVLITFYPHPKQVVINTKNPVYTLSSQSEKYRLLEEASVILWKCRSTRILRSSLRQNTLKISW
jgi:riboflavin kinase/FMN adenylyltransferase